jgi:hypothetical protein
MSSMCPSRSTIREMICSGNLTTFVMMLTMMMMMMTTTATTVLSSGTEGRTLVGRQRRNSNLKGSSTVTTERSSYLLPETKRGLVSETGDGYPKDAYYYPCTYYYGTRKKSKFNEYDDDWYDECKEDEDETLPHEEAKFESDENDDDDEDFGIGEQQQPEGGPLVPPIAPVPVGQGSESPGTAPWIDDEDENKSPQETADEEASVVTTRPPHALPPYAVPAPTSSTPSPVEMVNGEEEEDEDKDADTEDDTNEVEQDSDVEDPPFQVDEDPMCIAAQAGEVYPTNVNYTVYFQYELLTSRSFDWRGTVWPAVDGAFQNVLARELVDCTSGGKNTGSIHGVSPEPMDSSGTLSDDNSNACVNIQEFDTQQYVCDTVTGSVTVYFSEIQYMNSDNVTQLYLDTQNRVYDYLQSTTNGNSNDNGNRRTLLRQKQHTRVLSQADFLDPDRGIYGLYFLSQPVDFLTSDGSTAAGGPTLTESIQDGNRGETGNDGDSNFQLQSSDRNVNPAVAASIAGFTILTMIIVGFAIHRGKRSTDRDLGGVTFIKPVDNEPTDLSDLQGPESIIDDVSCGEEDYDVEENPPMRSIDTTADSDSFPIQNSPNAFRERPRTIQLTETRDTSPENSHNSMSARDLSSTPEEADTPRSAYRSMSTPIAPRETVITPSTAHRTMYSVEETVEEDASYDFSREGVSMRLTSPEYTLSNNSPRDILSDPPLQGTGRDPPDEEEKSFNRNMHPHELKILSSILDGRDESPTNRISEQSPGTPSSEQWTTRTVSVGNSASTSVLLAAANQILYSDDDRNSTITSGATIGISPVKRYDLSLGSSVQPPPSDFSSMSTSPVLAGHNNNGRVSKFLSPTSLRGSSKTPRKYSFMSSTVASRSARELSFGSPDPVGTSRTGRLSPGESGSQEASKSCRTNIVTPESLSKRDPPSSSEISRKIQSIDSSLSPDSHDSVCSRTEYLKSRRRALEERFQNYKDRLSETTLQSTDLNGNSLEEGPSMTVERAFSFDQNEESRDRGCFDTVASPQKAGSFPKAEQDSRERTLSRSGNREQRKRSRTPSRNIPRSKRDYTSLNDIEELLDQDQEWKQSDADERMRIDAFVSSRARVVSMNVTEEEESNLREISQTLDDLISSSRPYSSRMETRIYPQFQSDTVQL